MKTLLITLLLSISIFGQSNLLLLMGDDELRSDINLASTIAYLNALDNPYVSIVNYGNSILGRATLGLTSDNYTTPYKLTYQNLARVLYDSLTWNEATYRNIQHSDWVKTGAWEYYSPLIEPEFSAVDNDELGEPYDGATASIIVNNSQYIMFFFESLGLKQTVTTYDNTRTIENGVTGTGKAIIEVSINGGSDWVSPSTLLKNIDDTTEVGIDTVDTYFLDTSPYDEDDYQVNSFYKVGYVLDNSIIYDFRITYDSVAAPRGSIRFWGTAYWDGNTLFSFNVSNPGDNWNTLRQQAYGLIEKPDWDLVIFEVPVWHYGSIFPLSGENSDYYVNAFMSQMKTIHDNNGTMFVINDCMPGGIHPTGRWDGDSWTYYPGANIMNTELTYDGITSSVYNLFKYVQKQTRRYISQYSLGYVDIFREFENYIISEGDYLTSTGTLVDTTLDFYDTWRDLGTVNGYNYDSVYINTMTQFVDYGDGHHPSSHTPVAFYKWYEFLDTYLFNKVTFNENYPEPEFITNSIDRDFEPGDEVITNGTFTSNVTGYTNNGTSAHKWYNTDWNAVGKTNALLDSALAISAYVQGVYAFSISTRYKISYDYYIPTGNTSTNQVRARLISGNTPYLGLQTTTDAWATAQESITTTTAHTAIRFMLYASNNVSANTVGDIIYLDNISAKQIPNYLGAGNHSIDTSSTYKRLGSYSGAITASAGGNGTTNTISLASTLFTAVTSGTNYRFQVYAYTSTANTTLTFKLGDIVLTNIVPTTGMSVLNFDFKATASTTGDILLYLDKAATVYIDEVSLKSGS